MHASSPIIVDEALATYRVVEKLKTALLGSIRVLVIGDVMLDHHTDCLPPSRWSEHYAPILEIRRESFGLGGAANVARNLAALGAFAVCTGIFGEDREAEELQRLAGAVQDLDLRCVAMPGRSTTRKTRISVSGRQIVRLDDEDCSPVSNDVVDMMVDLIRAEIQSYDAVIFSDYGKGAVPRSLFEQVRSLVAEAAIPVIVDPYGSDPTKYSGATVLKPNAREAEALTGISCGTEGGAAEAAAKLLQRSAAERVVITRGDQGVTVADRFGATHQYPRPDPAVFDVCGAGDAVAAAVAIGMVADLDRMELAFAALGAGSAAVSTPGIQPVSFEKLQDNMVAPRVRSSWVCSAAAAVDLTRRWREDRRIVGFTNGCFDLLHSGHLHLLEGARSTCDALIVGLNSDDSVARLKGVKRPIQPAEVRAANLLATGLVNAVVIFETDTPEDLIRSLEPDVLVKGGDYCDRPIVGAEFVEANGGRVVVVDYLDGHSTTAIVRLLHSMSPN